MVHSTHKSTRLPIFVLILALLAGCSTGPTVITQAPSSPSPIPPTATSAPSNTPLPSPTMTATQPSPTATFTPLPPTQTPTLVPSDTPTLTPTLTLAPSTGNVLPAASGNSVMMYFIRVTPGSTDCGVAVGVSSGVPKSNDIAKDVEGALDVLFSIKEKFVGELLNPVSASSLRVRDVDFDADTGLITVRLAGKYTRTSDKCINTQVKAQVWSTIRQYGAVKATNIYLNNVPFGDLVSNDG